MTSFDYTTTEDFKGTRFGPYLIAILQRLELPMPRIKGFVLKKKHKEGTWGIKALYPGKEGEEPMVVKFVSDTMERGINLATQELIARLCGRYHTQLDGHYTILFGRRNEAGEPYYFQSEERGKEELVCRYLQDLEFLVTELHEDRRSELLRNDELNAHVKAVDAKIKAQQKENQALEKKFELQERRYKNQEKRVQRNNKEVTRLKKELEADEVELETDSDLIKRLRAEKWELQEKNSALEQEVKDLKQILDQEGLVVEEVEEVDETTMIEG